MNPSFDDNPIAHVSEDGRRHALKEHLVKTAQRASVFAEEFGAAEWGRLAGLWHDLGKVMDCTFRGGFKYVFKF
ncbi:MAG TPA: hypothetical protein ACFYD0_16055 [Candidatus Wunengus sp. YC65]|uniref:hypothetical protein n=1 Tax=Candidatus Wunengus sp. YC65 TaxID=3367701 RepID=UPI004027B056